MTNADLRRVEAGIGRPFPVTVREFFLNFPPGLRTPDEDHDLDADDFELTDDADALIAMNTGGSQRVWLPNAGPNFFALGCGGCGETWWVDLDDPNGAVYFADAGTYAEDSDRVADSLAEFAQSRIDSEEDESPAIDRRQAIDYATRFVRASLPELRVHVVQVFLLVDQWKVSFAEQTPGGWCETVSVDSRTGKAEWHET
jgi:hypothetical protein